jgi:hypothetical protein
MGSMANFFDSYVDKCYERIELVLCRKITEEEMQEIRSHLLQKYKELNSKDLVLKNTTTNTYEELSRWQLLDWLERRPQKPIIAGNGAFFKNHKEFDSQNVKITAYLTDARNIVKKEMLKLIEEGLSEDNPQVAIKDLDQKIWKLLANSLYGAFGEASFHFADMNLSTAITYTGQIILTTTVLSFEGFLAGNFNIRNTQEFWAFIHEVKNRSEENGDFENEFNEPLPDYMYEESFIRKTLKSACHETFGLADKSIELFLKKYKDNKLLMTGILLTGQIYNLFETMYMKEQLAVVLSSPVQKIEKHKLSTEVKDAFDRMWKVLDRWCVSKWIQPKCVRRIDDLVRRAVILGDTDSNFLNIQPWIDFVEKEYDFSSIEMSSEDMFITKSNSIIYFLQELSTFAMDDLSNRLNLPEEAKGILKFKNEFVMSRVVITDGKKNYIALELYKEGVKIPNGGSVVIKGLSFKKSGVAKSTGKYLKNVCEDLILRKQTINQLHIISSLIQLEQSINESLSKGETQYLTPAVVKNLAAYQNWDQIESVRATMAWNAVVPEDAIMWGDRINIVRSVIGTDVDLLEKILKDNYSVETEQAFEKLYKKFLCPNESDELLRKNGLNWLGIPKTVKSCPKWMTLLLDKEDVIRTNVNLINPLLLSVGIQTDSSDLFNPTASF